jgi:hypothetical protein
MMIMMAPEATAQDIAYVVARSAAVGRPDAGLDHGHELIKG